MVKAPDTKAEPFYLPVIDPDTIIAVSMEAKPFGSQSWILWFRFSQYWFNVISDSDLIVFVVQPFEEFIYLFIYDLRICLHWYT